MTLKIAHEEKPQEKEIYISFTDLYAKKQGWVEQKLLEGYRVFLNPKKGRALEISLVKYK
jgi:hypothetical protein